MLCLSIDYFSFCFLHSNCWLHAVGPCARWLFTIALLLFLCIVDTDLHTMARIIATVVSREGVIGRCRGRESGKPKEVFVVMSTTGVDVVNVMFNYGLNYLLVEFCSKCNRTLRLYIICSSCCIRLSTISEWQTSDLTLCLRSRKYIALFRVSIMFDKCRLEE
jgi:hypothetical protein